MSLTVIIEDVQCVDQRRWNRIGHGNRSEQQNRHVVRIRTRNRHTCQVSTVLNSESNKTNEIMSLFR